MKNKPTEQNQTTSARIWSWSIRKGVFALILILGIIPAINAQSSGSRGGVNRHNHKAEQYHQSEHQMALQNVEEYIKVASKVELRVKPDQIRIVLAIGGNAKTPSECEEKVFAKAEKLKADLVELGIESRNIKDDFIAILPRYQFEVEDWEGKKVAVEKPLDYSMQSNLHIKVPNDELAMKAIRAAFKLDITNVIAYDYWSEELDVFKQKSLEAALEKAKGKASLLLGSTFDERPAPINVISDTKVITPEKLYESFENVYSQTLQDSYRDRNDIPQIRAFRPKNTYFKGYNDPYADVQPKDVAMSCEISVVSTVQLFYASPVSDRLTKQRSFQVGLKKKSN